MKFIVPLFLLMLISCTSNQEQIADAIDAERRLADIENSIEVILNSMAASSKQADTLMMMRRDLQWIYNRQMMFNRQTNPELTDQLFTLQQPTAQPPLAPIPPGPNRQTSTPGSK